MTVRVTVVSRPVAIIVPWRHYDHWRMVRIRFHNHRRRPIVRMMVAMPVVVTFVDKRVHANSERRAPSVTSSAVVVS